MGEPFQTDNGLLYSQWLEFEDGSKGLAFSQAPQAPYGANDLVEVTDTGKKTKKGASKLKIKKAQGDSFPGSQGSSAGAQGASWGDREKGMRDGMICNVMSRLVASGKSVNEAYSLALQIVEVVESGKKIGGGAGPDGKLAFDPEEETDEVPF
jgi:hypothetical protein